jgi:hypothetical protein
MVQAERPQGQYNMVRKKCHLQEYKHSLFTINSIRHLEEFHFFHKLIFNTPTNAHMQLTTGINYHIFSYMFRLLLRHLQGELFSARSKLSSTREHREHIFAFPCQL